MGHEVYIFAPAPSLRYKETDPYIIRFPAVKGIGFEDYMSKFPWTPQAYRHAHRLKLDIIHLHTPSEMGIFGLAVGLKDDIPIVTTYHTDLLEYAKHYPYVLPGVLLLCQMLPFLIGKPELFRTSFRVMKPERSVDEWNRKIVRRMIPLENNLCDLVIAPSQKVATQLASWKTTKPIVILPTGVDKITTNSDEVAALLNKYQSLKNNKVILYVGRLAAEKNLELLIQSFALIQKRLPNTRLLIVGDNIYRKQLQKQARQLGITDKVIFTGYITDRAQLGAVYEISRVFAFPSLNDTQGLVVNEAASSGVPSVLIDQEVAEVVEQNISGLHAKNTAQDFANKLSLILTDDALHTKLSQGAKTKAAQFSAREQTVKLANLYQDIINQRAKAKQDQA